MSDTATPVTYTVPERAKQAIVERMALINKIQAELQSYINGAADAAGVPANYVLDPKEWVFKAKPAVVENRPCATSQP